MGFNGRVVDENGVESWGLGSACGIEASVLLVVRRQGVSAGEMLIDFVDSLFVGDLLLGVGRFVIVV